MGILHLYFASSLDAATEFRHFFPCPKENVIDIFLEQCRSLRQTLLLLERSACLT